MPVNSQPVYAMLTQYQLLNDPKCKLRLNKSVELGGDQQSSSYYNAQFLINLSYQTYNEIYANCANIYENDGWIKVRYHVTGTIIEDNDEGQGTITRSLDFWNDVQLTHENGDIGIRFYGYDGSDVRCDSFEFIDSNLDYVINLINNASN